MHTPPMDTPVLTGPLSLDDFFAMGVTDERYELVDGWLVQMSTPARIHQRVAFQLGKLLEPGCPPGYEVIPLPLDWVLHAGEPNVREPDLVILPLSDASRIEVAPLLVVEVISPDSRRRDLVVKREAYAGAGLEHYWVVDPDEPSVYVFAGEGLPQVAHATGDDELHLTQPVEVTLVPSALIRP